MKKTILLLLFLQVVISSSWGQGVRPRIKQVSDTSNNCAQAGEITWQIFNVVDSSVLKEGKVSIIVPLSPTECRKVYRAQMLNEINAYISESDITESDGSLPAISGVYPQYERPLTFNSPLGRSNGTVDCPTCGGGGSVPSGMILFIDTGACPSGWTELASAGNHLLLTVAANSDVGTTGGSNSYTPAGSVSQPTLTMNSYTPTGTNSAPGLTMNSYTPAGSVAAPIFTGNALGTHSHTFTGSALGTHSHGVGTLVVSWPVGTPIFTGSALATHTHTFTGTLATAASTTTTPKLVTANTSSGVAPRTTATGTNSSDSAGTPAGTNAWPASVPTLSGADAAVSAGTPAGSNSSDSAGTPSGTNSAPAFTGTPATLTGSVAAPLFTGTPSTPTGSVSQPAFTGNGATLQPTYLKLIACKKT